MLIIDAHLDLSMNALQGNRDLLKSAYTIRASETGMAGPGRGQGTVGLPDLRRGRIALCFATLIARSTGRPIPNIDYATPAQAFGMARGQLAYYRALERQGHIRIIADRASLDAHIAAWETWDTDPNADPATSPSLGFVISMESADPILSPDELQEWWDLGLRVIGPSHYGPGRYGGGTSTELGLTDIGGPLLDAMERVGMILDLTHFSDQAFWQAMDRFNGPVLASHNNCRALVPQQRQFDDNQLRALIERDGVIGSAFDVWMLKLGFVSGVSSNATIGLEKIVDHIDHICQLAGNTRHIAIGSDLDGGYGREQSPHDLDTIADMQKLGPLLSARGYTDDDIAAFFHGNWLRLLRRVWN